jgi:hypothetical protein
MSDPKFFSGLGLFFGKSAVRTIIMCVLHNSLYTVASMMSNDREIDTQDFEGFDSSVLGQLRLKVFELAKKQRYAHPLEHSLRKFIFETFREDALLGDLLFDICYAKKYFSVKYDDLNSPDIFTLLSELYASHLPSRSFLEIKGCDGFPSQELLLLVRQDTLTDNGQYYEIYLIDRVSFPEKVISRISLVIEENLKESNLVQNTCEGLENIDLASDDFDLAVKLSLAGLNYLNSHREMKRIGLSEIRNYKINRDDNQLRPPEDKLLLTLLQAAILQKIHCHQASIPISHIRPFDLKFCIDFPETVINLAIEEIRSNFEMRLLVYWDGTNFIMSDSYPVYLGYRKLAIREVPVIILGNFPKGLKVDHTGNHELIPPIGVSAFPLTRKTEYTDKDLERKLLGKESSQEISHLCALYIVLCKHLQDSKPLERKIHDFLCQNPVILDPQIKEIQTELCLGRDYRVDIAAKYQFDDKRILLIELERVDTKLFKRSGDLTAEVYHAYEQVENWLIWWQSNPDKLPQGFDHAVVPGGLVVAGRNSDLNESCRKKLVSLNSTRRVKLITYDTLLDRLENLINVLEGNVNLPSSRSQKITAKGFQKKKSSKRKNQKYPLS